MTKLFNTNHTKGGSIYITMKRLDPKPKKNKQKTETTQTQTQQTENKCLIRVHTSKKKISTIVAAKDVNKFQLVSHLLIYHLF